MVDYVLEIAKEMNVESVYSIMLPDNYRALSLTKKMGFALKYMSDGTVKGVLDLHEEIFQDRCLPKNEQDEFPLAKLGSPPASTVESEHKQEKAATAPA